MATRELLSVCTLLINFYATYVYTSNGTIDHLIPPTFLDHHPSKYTLRYLSHANGSDTEACLQDQWTAESISACQTLTFALAERPESPGIPVNAANITNTIILVSPGEYDYGGGIDVYESSGLIIAKNPSMDGEVVFQCVTLLEMRFNNLFFKYVDHVAISGIVGTNCGIFGANMAFQFVTDLAISNCTFRNNFGGALEIAHPFNVIIEETIFLDNINAAPYNNSLEFEVSRELGSTRYSGGLTIFFRNLLYGSHVIIRKSIFKNNKASVNEYNQEDTKQRPTFYIPRGHGGSLLVLFKNSSYNKLTIEDSMFIGNTAELRGGAISILFYRGSADVSSLGASSSNNNSVTINGCIFHNNMCQGYGGAIDGHAFEAAIANNIFIQNSTIRNNSADQGAGGISFSLQIDLNSTAGAVINNGIRIENSVFEYNLSPEGSAINLISYGNGQVNSTAVLSNCVFRENRGRGGALYSLHHPLTLKGSNQWIRNEQAVVLYKSRVICHGDILFMENNGMLGGAVQLNDNSGLTLTKGVHLSFIRNFALMHGGAVHVFTSPLEMDIDSLEVPINRCFFTYNEADVQPPDWEISVSFLDNAAGISGADIYATDIYSCSFIPMKSEAGLGGFETALIFGLSDIFSFRNSSDSLAPIATEPVKINTSFKNKLTGAPGQKLLYNLGCVDRLQNFQPCTYSASLSQGLFYLSKPENTKSYQVGKLETYNLTSDNFRRCINDSKFKISTNQSFSLIQPTTGDVLSTTGFSLEISCCPPGYALQNGTCELTREHLAVLRKDNETKYLYLEPVQYADIANGSIMVSPMPLFYQECSQQGALMGCLFEYDYPDKQCSQDRTGFLCGSCPKGKSIDLTLTTCITCLWWHTFLIIVIVLLFAAVCSLVMVYNIGVPDVLKGSLYYVQVIGFVYDRTGTTVLWDFHLSNIFGSTLYLPLCPYPGYNALFTASFGFILPLVAIVTIIVHVLCAKCVRRLSNKTSFDGIWLLSFIIYKFIADTCFRLLRCQRITYKDRYEYVYWYDGNLKCFSTDSTESIIHLVFTIGALLLSVGVFVFPIIILVISYKRFRLTQNITDVLNKGIRESTRWWSSFDLFRRIFIIAMVLFFSYVSPQYSKLALLFCNLFIFIVFALAKPYTSKKAVYTETVLLLDIILISCFSLNSSTQMRSRGDIFSIILLISPFIVTLLYIFLKGTIIILCYLCPIKFKNIRIQLQNKLNALIMKFTDKEDKSPSVNVTAMEYEMDGQEVLVITVEKKAEKPFDAFSSEYREPLLDECED